MGFSRTLSCFIICSFLLTHLQTQALEAQESDRIWARILTTSGQTHEGFIRWDRNELSWADILDGSKDFSPFQFEDWWDLAHPGDRQRDRVIELAGYRITWDDDEPEFPDTHESGIRVGHVSRLTPSGNDRALLQLKSGKVVELESGATDLGDNLREILVTERGGGVVELGWEDLQEVEFSAAPAGIRAPDRRLHGTLELGGGSRFTGFITWDMQKALTSDTLVGYDEEDDRREILFGRIAAIEPIRGGAEITLSDGETVELFGTDDVDDDNDGILISDPTLGSLEVGWDEMESVRFHPFQGSLGFGDFDGGRRLRGTVMTSDSTELTGFVRWDGDEEFTWELLDGYYEGVGFDIEFGKIASIERDLGMSTAVEVGPTGVNVETEVVEGARVTLWDGRSFDLTGSNDVDDDNDGIFLLQDGSGQSPDDTEAEWVMVKWTDFRSIRFHREDGR
jgi:hypothetical protein